MLASKYYLPGLSVLSLLKCLSVSKYLLAWRFSSRRLFANHLLGGVVWDCEYVYYWNYGWTCECVYFVEHYSLKFSPNRLLFGCSLIGQYREALLVKLSYYKNWVVVFLFRKKFGDRFLCKSSRIQKWQNSSESDRIGLLRFVCLGIRTHLTSFIKLVYYGIASLKQEISSSLLQIFSLFNNYVDTLLRKSRKANLLYNNRYIPFFNSA
jgi:hypothetical protein